MIESRQINNTVSEVIAYLDSKLDNKYVSPELYNDLYLIATGMIIYYGKKYKELIYDTISSLDFIENKYGVLNSFIRADKKDVYLLDSHTIYISSGSINPILRLEKMIYIINSLVTNIRNNTVDKSINALQAEDIVKIILKLRYLKINNDVFVKALSSYYNVDLEEYNISGNEIIVNLFRIIYEYGSVKDTFRINIIENKNIVKEELDNILGEGSYDIMNTDIDKIIRLFNESINNAFVSKYDVASLVVKYRDDYLKKYIANKYKVIYE